MVSRVWRQAPRGRSYACGTGLDDADDADVADVRARRRVAQIGSVPGATPEVRQPEIRVEVAWEACLLRLFPNAQFEYPTGATAKRLLGRGEQSAHTSAGTTVPRVLDRYRVYATTINPNTIGAVRQHVRTFKTPQALMVDEAYAPTAR